jgi:imidazole glycerol phosphate synthase subunit HisF
LARVVLGMDAKSHRHGNYSSGYEVVIDGGRTSDRQTLWLWLA